MTTPNQAYGSPNNELRANMLRVLDDPTTNDEVRALTREMIVLDDEQLRAAVTVMMAEATLNKENASREDILEQIGVLELEAKRGWGRYMPDKEPPGAAKSS